MRHFLIICGPFPENLHLTLIEDAWELYAVALMKKRVVLCDFMCYNLPQRCQTYFPRAFLVPKIPLFQFSPEQYYRESLIAWDYAELFAYGLDSRHMDQLAVMEELCQAKHIRYRTHILTEEHVDILN